MGLRYANELVSLKELHPDIGIGVAGYPETHPKHLLRQKT